MPTCGISSASGLRLAVGKPALAPAGRAVDHDPFDLDRAAEQALRPRRADLLAMALRMREDEQTMGVSAGLCAAVAVESARAGTGTENAGTTSVGTPAAASRPQDLSVAAAPAEVEVVADADRIGLQAVEQQLRHELRRSPRGKAVIKGLLDQDIDAAGRKELSLATTRGDERGPRHGATTRTGCGQNDSTTTSGGPRPALIRTRAELAAGLRPTEQLLMAQMDAIEVADDHHAPSLVRPAPPARPPDGTAVLPPSGGAKSVRSAR